MLFLFLIPLSCFLDIFSSKTHQKQFQNFNQTKQRLLDIILILNTTIKFLNFSGQASTHANLATCDFESAVKGTWLDKNDFEEKRKLEIFEQKIKSENFGEQFCHKSLQNHLYMVFVLFKNAW